MPVRKEVSGKSKYVRYRLADPDGVRNLLPEGYDRYPVCRP
jgi:ribosomal protein L32E